MSRLVNLLYPKSTDGWVTSVAGVELVDGFFNEFFSKPSFKTISLRVDQECQIELVLGDRGVKEVLTINEITGLELDLRFQYVYSFKFLSSGVSYYMLASY